MTIEKAIQKAKQGKRQVMLIVKGQRPMFRPHYPYETNYFYIGKHGCISVPDMCKLVSVDPKLIEDIYSYYRQVECWADPCPSKKQREKEILITRKQIITNIFPFPAIAWKRQSGATGEIYLLKFLRRNATLSDKDIMQIREKCNDDKAISKSFFRHLYKGIKRRNAVAKKEIRPKSTGFSNWLLKNLRVLPK